MVTRTPKSMNSDRVAFCKKAYRSPMSCSWILTLGGRDGLAVSGHPIVHFAGDNRNGTDNASQR
jgi:hypothetical protein